MRELAGSPRWRARLGDLAWPAAHDPQDYLAALAAPGRDVTAWETTYLHVLPGADPVLDWVSSTGLRPVLGALEEAERAEFSAAYGEALRAAFPRRAYGTVLPYRRVFVVVVVVVRTAGPA